MEVDEEEERRKRVGRYAPLDPDHQATPPGTAYKTKPRQRWDKGDYESALADEQKAAKDWDRLHQRYEQRDLPRDAHFAAVSAKDARDRAEGLIKELKEQRDAPQRFAEMNARDKTNAERAEREHQKAEQAKAKEEARRESIQKAFEASRGLGAAKPGVTLPPARTLAVQAAYFVDKPAKTEVKVEKVDIRTLAETSRGEAFKPARVWDVPTPGGTVRVQHRDQEKRDSAPKEQGEAAQVRAGRMTITERTERMQGEGLAGPARPRGRGGR